MEERLGMHLSEEMDRTGKEHKGSTTCLLEPVWNSNQSSVLESSVARFELEVYLLRFSG